MEKYTCVLRIREWYDVIADQPRAEVVGANMDDAEAVCECEGACTLALALRQLPLPTLNMVQDAMMKPHEQRLMFQVTNSHPSLRRRLDMHSPRAAHASHRKIHMRRIVASA